MANAASYGAVVEVCLDPSEGAVAIRISDRDPDIPGADKERVFEPFVRLDSAFMYCRWHWPWPAVARSLVLAHGGTLALADRVGGRVDVIVELPR